MAAPSNDLGITSALTAIILPLGIIPTTTLTAAASVGDASVTVASNARFTQGSMVLFNDTAGEEPTPAALPTGTTALPMTFSDTGRTGLQFAHASGTQVYTNLLDFAPPTLAQMLALGDPMIWVYVAEQQDRYTAFRQSGPTYSVLIRYHRLILQPGAAAKLNTNVWSRRQQRAARQDIETIADAIRQNPRLVTTAGVFAINLGMRRSSGPTMQRSWSILVQQDDSQQFVADLKLTVQGGWESITPK